jgi:hypothetical protein
MAHRRRAQPAREPFDFDRFQEDLVSPDAEVRARAARQICPCRLGWEVFERCMEQVEPLRKDPSPDVRAAALHVFEDAFEMQSRGLPTTPQELKNEMVARRRAGRWGDVKDDSPESDRRDWRHSAASHGRGGWRARHRGFGQ